MLLGLLMLPLARSVKLFLIVLAFNRPNELLQTLKGLDKFIMEEITPLKISIDGPADDELVKGSKHIADSFDWRHGPKTVAIHDSNRGILGQWLEAWNPPSDDEYALIIEDDINISPFAIRYLKHILTKYKNDKRLFGIALQRAQWQIGICERKRWRRLDLVTEPPDYAHFFRYPTLGTWGQLLFPSTWRQFLSEHSDFLQSDGIHGLVTEEWAKRGRRLISPVFTRWALSKGLLNLYANFGNSQALAHSRRPPGVNFQGASRLSSSDVSFPSEDEIQSQLANLGDVRTMSPCFDPVDLTPDEHLTRYKMIITNEGSSKQLNCCLGLFRIYPIPLHHAASQYPRLVMSSSNIGCFTMNPLDIAQNLTCNTRFVSIDGGEVMKYQIDDGPNFETRLLHHYDDQMSLVNSKNICSSYYCPFSPGLYPDKL